MFCNCARRAYGCISYDQSVVAKLPFTPMPLIQGITHRGIAGSDYTDCSFFFLYALCQVRLWVVLCFYFPKNSVCAFLFGIPADLTNALCLCFAFQFHSRSRFVPTLSNCWVLQRPRNTTRRLARLESPRPAKVALIQFKPSDRKTGLRDAGPDFILLICKPMNCKNQAE